MAVTFNVNDACTLMAHLLYCSQNVHICCKSTFAVSSNVAHHVLCQFMLDAIKKHEPTIWAVGLPVFPPVCLPSLASTRAPLKPRPSRHCLSRLFRPAVRRLCLPQAYRARPNVHPSNRRPAVSGTVLF